MPKFSESKPEPVIDNPRDDEARERSLEDIVQETGEMYFIEKDAKEDLADLRLEFFDAATKAAAGTKLAQKTVALPSTVAYADAEAYVAKYHTGWTKVQIKEIGGGLKAILQQDPNLIKYALAVPVPEGVDDERAGYVVTKSIVSGSMVLDGERLKAEDPDLFDSITEWPMWDALTSMAYALLSTDDGVDAAVEAVLKSQGVEKVLKKLSDIPAETQKALAPYLYETPKTIKLLVKEAKGKDLAGA